MKACTVFLSILLSAALLLGGCSSSSSFPEVTGPQTGGNGNGNGNGNGDGDSDPTPIGEITDEDSVLLARSVMAMTGGLAAIGEITTQMVRKGAGLLAMPVGSAVDMPECNEAIEPGPFTNRVSHETFAAGFQLPAGSRLQANFTDCLIDNLLVRGTLHIASITRSGDPAADAGNWSFSATVFHGPFEFIHGNGTLTSYFDKFRYSAVMTGGVLTVDVEAASDPDAGLIGGLNAQHHLSMVYNDDTAINYQFRPFRITITDNGNTDEYRIVVQTHTTDGASLLNRYTLSPSSEIILGVSTAPAAPIVWQNGKPDSYLELPASGEVRLVDGPRSIVATVTGDGVVLTVTVDGAVTAGTIPWEELLTAPES